MSSATVIAPVRDTDFVAEAAGGDGELSVKMSGNADLNVKTSLDRFLTAVHEEARRARARAVSIDLRRLEFMNSSCLKSFVWWITAVQELPADEQYRITFVSSAAMYWQRRSLNALACLAADLVSVSS